MNAKIKAALLGDVTAAAECTAAGIAIPCPFCGTTEIVGDGLDCYCDKCGAQASILKLWNHRAPIQTENAEKDREIVRLQAKAKQWKQTSEENFASCERLQAILTRVEAERDAYKGRHLIATKNNVKLEAKLNAAVSFIRHIDREYGRYIFDAGFDRWRGAQGVE